MQRLVRFLILSFLLGGNSASAESTPVDVYVFWAQGCPHCARALHFLSQLDAEQSGMDMHPLEITGNDAHMQIFLKLSRSRYPEPPRIPLIVIGDRQFAGYNTDRTTGNILRHAIFECMQSGCPDQVQPLLAGRNQPVPASGIEPVTTELPRTIDIPLLGSIEIDKLSLPALTLILGAADGFNPCAMWTLVFLLGLLVGIPNRLRRWTLGTVFIVTSALVYYLIMAAWLNVLLFIGVVAWIRILIGTVAVTAGLWALREYVLHPQVVCRVTHSENRRRVLDSLRNLAAQPHFMTAILGIAGLAFAVNVVELICSAGIPAVYTQVLTMSDLPRWQYHGYLGLYILVFMLDDLIVFITAMATLEISGLTGSYSRWANLIGGLVLLIIGSLLILRPEWLAFA